MIDEARYKLLLFERQVIGNRTNMLLYELRLYGLCVLSLSLSLLSSFLSLFAIPGITYIIVFYYPYFSSLFVTLVFPFIYFSTCVCVTWIVVMSIVFLPRALYFESVKRDTKEYPSMVNMKRCLGITAT